MTPCMQKIAGCQDPSPNAERQASVGFKKPGEPMPQLGVEKKSDSRKMIDFFKGIPWGYPRPTNSGILRLCSFVQSEAALAILSSSVG